MQVIGIKQIVLDLETTMTVETGVVVNYTFIIILADFNVTDRMFISVYLAQDVLVEVNGGKWFESQEILFIQYKFEIAIHAFFF